MMNRMFNLPAPPAALADYLERLGQSAMRLRRRAVLMRPGGNNWTLLCCTVEGHLDTSAGSVATSSRRYADAILYEDWLTADECRRFIDEIQAGKVAFSDISIARNGNPTWQMERLPLKNTYMARAGLCVVTPFQERSAGIAQGPLLAAGEPYYPELHEAAGHWLPFPVYHGQSDARNQEVIFLLPEVRAFFADAKLRDGALEVSVGGTEAASAALTVKGAFWKNRAMHHFEKTVRDGVARISVPGDAHRLEYVLMNADGAVYDFQQENRFNDSGLGMHRLDGVAQELVQQVLTACLDGEGMHNEFKPFIYDVKAIGPKDQKTKLRQLVTSVVAFANTQGGRIYIGINNECGLEGISESLQKWSKRDVNDEVADQYCRALTARLRDHLIGDIHLRIAHVTVNSALVVVVEVSPTPAKPAMVKDDNILYVRAGANNKQLPPDQWQSVLGGRPSPGIFQLDPD
ncbi:MAG: AlbA family DNA-binding domain-containing protein [Terriglobia bacterium]